MRFHNMCLQTLREGEFHATFVTSKIVPLDPMACLHVLLHVVSPCVLLITTVPHASELHSFVADKVSLQPKKVLRFKVTLVARVMS